MHDVYFNSQDPRAQQEEPFTNYFSSNTDIISLNDAQNDQNQDYLTRVKSVQSKIIHQNH
jgi:hypothetical protein